MASLSLGRLPGSWSGTGRRLANNNPTFSFLYDCEIAQRGQSCPARGMSMRKSLCFLCR